MKQLLLLTLSILVLYLGMTVRHQRAELSGLSARIKELKQTQILEATRHQQEIETYKTEIARLASAPQPIISTAKKLLEPRLLKVGLYTLEREITYDNSKREPETRRFSIYHIKTTIPVGDSEYQLNLGVATSGVQVPKFYIDYTNDGRIDAEIMHEYVYYLPFGRLMSRSFDPYLSQVVYQAFLEQADKAVFTSAEGIQAQGNEVAKELWNFVQKSSGELARWIQNNPEPSSTLPPELPR